MGKLNILQEIKNVVAEIALRLFLWGNDMSREYYWKLIYEQEKDRESA